jgi:hypothetical protein
MSSRGIHDDEQRTSSPRVRRAVTRSLDVLADCLPEILAMSDVRMLELEVKIERALVRALKPPDPRAGGIQVRQAFRKSRLASPAKPF